jgi:radical SAM protein with 4Fe4S-binding SPASM domain
MFKDQGQFCFNISLDGMREGHESSRIGFDKVSQNLERLLDSQIVPVVRTTAHKKNLFLIEELFPYVNELGKRYGQKIAIDVQPVAGSHHLLIDGFDSFRLNLDEYLSVAWNIHLRAPSDFPHVESRWRFLDEMIFGFFPGSRQMISEKGAIFGCAGGFSFEIHANGDVARCEMDNPIVNLRYEHTDKDISLLFDRLEKLNSPLKKCILCKYKWSCGMCRLSPVMHGYTFGFGYADCRKLMRDVEKWHLDHRTAAQLAEPLTPEEQREAQ